VPEALPYRWAVPSRVAHSDRIAPDVEPAIERWPLVPPERGSELALDAVHLRPSGSLDVLDELHDTLVYVHTGAASLSGSELVPHTAGFVAAGSSAGLAAGEEGFSAVRATLGAATDLHAPMGARETAVALDHVEPGKATGARSFQVLFGPHNGCVRATMFVGYIPPGAAPWHYHLYDEIVWIVRGEGRLHVGDVVEPLAPGSAFRLHPREVHVVENTQPKAELVVLGIFTPAGSPSAAYLAADVAATYGSG
jgi:quercetin dioxygenase-like cupin family protein